VISLSRYQFRVLAILALINFVNFADRMVIVPLFPLLRADFPVRDAELGALQTALQIVLALGTIPFGLLADRISRTRIIAAGVIFWSLATFLTGLAGTFAMLLLSRALVGMGEAVYGPSAQSIISSVFPPQTRARALAIFAAGMLIGGAGGQALGGVLGEAFGWRSAFFLVGFPGLLLGLLVMRLREPPRAPQEALVPVGRLLRVPAFLGMLLSGTLITFAGLSIVTWGADFVQRYKGFSTWEAGVLLGTLGFFSLVLGVLVGGSVADRLQQKWVHGRVAAIAFGFAAAAPFVVWGVHAEEKATVLAAFFGAGFFMSWYHGPVTAVIHDLMPARAHATSVGVYMFVTQLAGAFGPQLVGQISDAWGLHTGLEVAAGVLLAGAACYLLVIRCIRRDGLRHPLLDAWD